MNTNTHFVYVDLLYNCLSLGEADATALIKRDAPKPFTYPDPYPQCPELAGYEVKGAPLYIRTANRVFAGAAYSEIYMNGVRSVPSEVLKAISCDYLSKRHDLEGVPGFYQVNNRWKLNTPLSGLLKPYRDESNRILGLFIYQTSIPGLLSSEGLYKGTPAIQPLFETEREVA